MASPGNRHCASCIGTLSFPMSQRQLAGMCDVSGCLNISQTYESLLLLLIIIIIIIVAVAEWLACWTQAQKGPGSNRSRDALG